ncbi:MAG TPA: ATP-binding cassette domain-containing protein [Solirubrobacteraceae bacterium]|nr:ATP-binding cassette domain-containing protein [Solirubrobacteraceae bacterium]
MSMATVTDTRTVLRLTDIWKRFPGVVALRGVSLELRSGEVHALLGENGAGKSTLMAVASGALTPDEGTIAIDGQPIDHLTPGEARAHRLTIVHQHPAVVPDLTVAENLALASPHVRPTAAWMREQLERVDLSVSLGTRLERLTVAQRQLLELTKALAIQPRVLILDEPTAPLGADRVALVFSLVRTAAAQGTAVVYISHRLAEVRQIADHVTVMRDGAVRGSAPIEEMSDEEMLRLIVGREVSATFPEKRGARKAGEGLRVSGLSNGAFSEVDLVVRPGEIVGVAGIAGNGQSEFLRALAGLEPAKGEVTLDGRPLRLGNPVAAQRGGVAYMPADRHGEGLLMGLSVRENATLASLPRYVRGGLVSRRAEVSAVTRQRDRLGIRTASLETEVNTLSGGNQQKVVLARAMLSDPKLVLADEPTQGVDVGARAEIYRILRELAAGGVPVLIVSSDGLELEGLCDRVVVFSRGAVVAELSGAQVSDEEIARGIVTATSMRSAERAPAREHTSRREGVRRFLSGDYFPSIVLALVIVGLALYTDAVNARFLATFNVSTLLVLIAALAFIGYGQAIVIMTAGIDISVGPLSGLVVVIASFFLTAGKSTPTIVLGLLIMLGASLATGLINGLMIRIGRFTAIAATLVTYIGLQGISLLLRPFQGGYIAASITNAIQITSGPIPLAFVVAVIMAIVLEVGLRRTRWGLALRAAGSREDSAHRLGVRVDRTIVGAYIACSALTFLGGLMLMAQVGVGDPTQGVTYTLASITAVVLGGASLFGGRGSFIATLLGAILIQETINATTFLALDQAWQYWFQGVFVLVAAIAYTLARRSGRIA